jgi:LPS export ABC transporter protein LptC
MKAAAGIVLCAMLCVACEEQTRIGAVADDPAISNPSHVSYNVRVVFSDSTSTRAIVQSPVGRIFDDKQQTTLSDSVIVDFFDTKSGHRAARLTSDSAFIDDRSQTMVAIGNVFVWSDSTRSSLSTSELWWDDQRRILHSDKYVKIVTPQETIEGVGFESDQYLKSYRIYRVKGIQR